MKTSVTGIKPTGAPHLGNFLGMIQPALELANETNAIYFIADYHALTTMRDPARLRALTHQAVATWLALGLDPSRDVLYRQSDVPEVCELSWLLGCATPKGLLNRAHAYKAAIEKNQGGGRDPDAGVNVGFFSYPVLMAADILIHRADLVPVGSDQRQHVEIARDVGLAFGRSYRQLFPSPEPVVRKDVQTVPGLDGRKMSKSYGNVIPLFVPVDELRRRVFAIVTDSLRADEPKDPESCTIFALYRHVASPKQTATVRRRYLDGEIGYREAKALLVDALAARFEVSRDRYNDLLADPAALEAVLDNGAQRARLSARSTLDAVRQAMGVGKP